MESFVNLETILRPSTQYAFVQDGHSYVMSGAEIVNALAWFNKQAPSVRDAEHRPKERTFEIPMHIAPREAPPDQLDGPIAHNQWQHAGESLAAYQRKDFEHENLPGEFREVSRLTMAHPLQWVVDLADNHGRDVARAVLDKMAAEGDDPMHIRWAEQQIFEAKIHPGHWQPAVAAREPDPAAWDGLNPDPNCKD